MNLNNRLGAAFFALAAFLPLTLPSFTAQVQQSQNATPRIDGFDVTPTAKPVAGSYLGMIGGGVVGALLGSRVGHGTGTTVAEVAGAAGGAWAGNEIEKRIKTSKHYDVVVRLENGSAQTVSYAAQPTLGIGARVRVESGVLVAA